MRLGLVGDESSHVTALVNYLREHPELGELTTVVQPTRDWGDVLEVCDPRDLVGLVDGVAVMHRDADQHLPASDPLLRAGLRVFVDKPFSPSVSDARRMIEAASTGGAEVLSGSALRWLPQTEALRANHNSAAVTVEVSGPVDRRHPHGGIAFYAPHSIELALQLSAGPLRWLDVEVRSEETVVKLGRNGPVQISLREADVPFEAAVTGPHGEREHFSTKLGPGYYRPTAERIIAFLAGKPPLVSHEELIASAQVLEAVVDAVAGADR